MAGVDAATVHTLRELLAPTGWVERSRDFATSMRRFTRTPGGLLLLGTPVEEPWHLTAHLDDEARWSGVAELAPTWFVGLPRALAPPSTSATARPHDEERHCWLSRPMQHRRQCWSESPTSAARERPS